MARTGTPTQARKAEPVVIAAEGADDTAVVDATRAKTLSLDEPESLYPVVVHRSGCPQAGASMGADNDGNEGNGWASRMEVSPATVPAANGEPNRHVHVVRCQDCGAQVRIDNL